jgi:hypothetical protein
MKPASTLAARPLLLCRNCKCAESNRPEISDARSGSLQRMVRRLRPTHGGISIVKTDLWEARRTKQGRHLGTSVVNAISRDTAI